LRLFFPEASSERGISPKIRNDRRILAGVSENIYFPVNYENLPAG
jgi:hypothetical protein